MQGFVDVSFIVAATAPFFLCLTNSIELAGKYIFSELLLGQRQNTKQITIKQGIIDSRSEQPKSLCASLFKGRKTSGITGCALC